MNKMKKRLILLFLVIALVFTAFSFLGCEETEPETELRLLCYNVRLWTFTDMGDTAWNKRRPLIVEQILAKSADVICLQEVTEIQKNHFAEDLTEEYEMIWYGRDNLINTEGLAILYKKDKFDLVDSGVFWLSETPEEMSKGWDSSCYRICVNATVKYKNDDKKVSVFNVHLDHKGEESRNKGIKLIIDKAKVTESPSIICGDFNATINSSCIESFADSTFVSAQETATVSDSGETHNGYEDTDGSGLAIDHVYVDENFKVNKFEICDEKYNNEIFYSDHYALLVDMIVLNKENE